MRKGKTLPSVTLQMWVGTAPVGEPRQDEPQVNDARKASPVLPGRRERWTWTH